MQELIKRLEKDKWHVSGGDIQEAINLLESQAAEIAALQETLDAVAKVASDAEKLVISQRDEIATLKALCDQMGVAISKCRFDSLNMSAQDMVQASSAFAAWREIK